MQQQIKLAKFDEQPPCMTSPYQVKMHSKTTSQFPSELFRLDDKIRQGEQHLGHLKRGKSLFKLMEEERKKKVNRYSERGNATSNFPLPGDRCGSHFYIPHRTRF